MENKTSKEQPHTLNAVGKSVVRQDAFAKATGKALYASDISKPGMLYAKALLSTQPHALIKSIETKNAAQMPGVKAVLTARDVPGVNSYGLAIADQQVLADKKVRFIGEPVAVVIAEEARQAEEAVAKIIVEYEPLPAVFDPLSAMKEGAPVVHEKGNLILHTKVRKGDINQGIAESDLIVENVYTTPGQDHCALEPENGIGWLDADGTLVISSPSQGVFRTRNQIAQSLGLPINRIRVICSTVGGGFGRKDDISVEIMIGMAVLKTGCPVKLTYSRHEAMLTQTHRHPVIVKARTGATRKGKLTFMEAVMYGDTGAYCSLGIFIIKRSTMHLGGPYYFPHYKADSFSVYTNNPISGAFRGFGVVQAAVVHEGQIDELAEKLSMDPLDFRLMNCLRPGLTNATGQVVDEGCGIEATLLRLKEYQNANGIQINLKKR